jgi:hypothetical protein
MMRSTIGKMVLAVVEGGSGDTMGAAVAHHWHKTPTRQQAQKMKRGYGRWARSAVADTVGLMTVAPLGATVLCMADAAI